MPLIEEVEDSAGPSWSPVELSTVLKELSARLALPEELLASFMGGDIREPDCSSNGAQAYQGQQKRR